MVEDDPGACGGTSVDSPIGGQTSGRSDSFGTFSGPMISLSRSMAWASSTPACLPFQLVAIW